MDFRQPPTVATTSKRIFIFSFPRTVSNLLARTLEAQPDFVYAPYLLFGAGLTAQERFFADDLTKDPVAAQQRIYAAYQRYADMLQTHLTQVEANGKNSILKDHIPFLAEPSLQLNTLHPTLHAQPLTVTMTANGPTEPPKRTNPTILPDAFLLTLHPIIPVRHPALMYASAQRARSDSYAIDTSRDPRFATLGTLADVRALYNWFARAAAANPTAIAAPVVVDADDLVGPDHVALLRRLCAVTGMDPDALQFEWRTGVAMDTAEARRYQSTLNASTGVVRGRFGEGLNLEAEARAWEGEFGVEVAGALGKMVGESMADYEYLRERRLRVA